MADSEAKSIWRHSRIYAVGSILNRSSGFILLPVYAHVLTPADYGVYAIVVVVTELLSVVLGLGLGRALVRMYVEASDEREKARVSSTAFCAFGGMCLLFAALTPWIAEHTVLAIYDEPTLSWIFAIAIWGMLFTALFHIQLSLIM